MGIAAERARRQFSAGAADPMVTPKSSRRRHARPRLLWIAAAAVLFIPIGCFAGPPPPTTAHVYLTFDDGPSAYTPQILTTLEQRGVRATFFVVGANASSYPSYVQRENGDGDVIGDHTWNHPDLTTLPPDQVRQQLESTADEIEFLTANRPTLWRPPYGRYNSTVTQIASSLGLSMRLWNVDPRDWSLPGTAEIVQRVVDNVRNGDIVLLHDGGGDRSQTVAALGTIISTLQSRGYRFDTL
jgi:peptidoglycan/xylan/chitin deacetylase (PgdA/CDA1 family)